MKELLTYLIQNLVDHPDEVAVTERASGGETIYDAISQYIHPES